MSLSYDVSIYFIDPEDRTRFELNENEYKKFVSWVDSNDMVYKHKTSKDSTKFILKMNITTINVYMKDLSEFDDVNYF